MTYRKIFDLKFKKGVSTYDLVRQFPHEIHRVSEIAMLDLPNEILRDVVREEKTLGRLLRLKKKFSKLL